jgi:hypothetical protein
MPPNVKQKVPSKVNRPTITQVSAHGTHHTVSPDIFNTQQFYRLKK